MPPCSKKSRSSMAVTAWTICAGDLIVGDEAALGAVLVFGEGGDELRLKLVGGEGGAPFSAVMAWTVYRSESVVMVAPSVAR